MAISLVYAAPSPFVWLVQINVVVNKTFHLTIYLVVLPTILLLFVVP